MTLDLQKFLILSAVLFCIGLYGALVKRNAVTILMCIEIMLNAANIAAVAFSQYVNPMDFSGQILAIFSMVIAAAEVAIGLAIVITIYRNHKSIDVDKIDLMKW